MSQKGFTLVELAIALLIIGLLLAGILGPISVQLEQKDRQGTQDQLEDIREALLGFAITHGRLPCPDSDSTPDGIENPPSGITACAAVYGTLPYITLGVPEYDAWREHFTYAVTSDFADSLDGANNEVTANRPNPCGTATAGVSFELCSGGDLDIVDAATSGNPVVNDVPALVFSTGKHGTSVSGGQSPDEIANTDGNNIFVFKDFSQASGAEFDDLMIWISPNILKNRMVQAGRLP